MREDDRVRILHMIDAAESVIRFVEGRKRADLDGDRMLLCSPWCGVSKCSVNQPAKSPTRRAVAPTIPWSAITSMRNRLIHGYFDIDADIVWKTATQEIPGLLSALRPLVEHASDAASETNGADA